MTEEQIKAVVEELKTFLTKSNLWHNERILSVGRAPDLDELYEVAISHVVGSVFFHRDSVDNKLRMVYVKEVYTSFPKEIYTPYEAQ